MVPDLPGEDPVITAIRKLEAKLDIAIAQHRAELDLAARHDTDHEERLRALEARQTVTPKALWSVVVGASAVLATALPLLQLLYSATP